MFQSERSEREKYIRSKKRKIFKGWREVVLDIHKCKWIHTVILQIPNASDADHTPWLHRTCEDWEPSCEILRSQETSCRLLPINSESLKNIIYIHVHVCTCICICTCKLDIVCLNPAQGSSAFFFEISCLPWVPPIVLPCFHLLCVHVLYKGLVSSLHWS